MVRAAVALGLALALLLGATLVGATNVVDIDGDAVPVGAELLEGTDPLAADTDGDGLADGTELEGRSDPTVADTDGDGLADAAELEDGTDPSVADTDGDGLADGAERDRHGTDPLAADTDDDGLDDRAELETHGTDPLDRDTDGDGIDDGAEVERHGTDPTAADTDGDGLTDAAELEAHGTDPTAPDTDDDGLGDATEVEAETDATVADTDDDGLADGRERELGTDPLDPDTDGDRLLDGWEVAGATAASDGLSDADPRRLDLYVQVDYARPAGPEPGVSDRVEGAFAEMPIENPDGSTGIAAHVVEGTRTEEVVSYNGTNFEALRAEYHAAPLGERADRYRQVLVAEFDADVGHSGRAVTPGHFSVVAADAERYHVIVHELLHNAVGRLDVPEACPDDPYHHCTGGGWLEPRTRAGPDDHLIDSVATRIEEEGFAD